MTDYSSYKYYRVTKPAEFVLHVEFNRPKVRNAVHRDSYLEYHNIFQKADIDPDVRVVLLSGVGSAFCAGLDVKSSQFPSETDETSRKGIQIYRHIKEFQNAIHAPYKLSKRRCLFASGGWGAAPDPAAPLASLESGRLRSQHLLRSRSYGVWGGAPAAGGKGPGPDLTDAAVIAVAHGACVGLGIDIISAVDIRYASRDAILSVREVVIGMAADIGSLQRLPRIVGNTSWLKEATYTGRDFSADEGKEQGLISKVFDTKEQALEGALALAKDIAEKSPIAVYGSKRSLNYAKEHSIESGLDQIAEFNGHGLGEDFVNGIMAAFSKSKPRYEKL
ncbi:hypothetical protein AWJ20_4385 [Sugiyamaella lignohabitans]|uniref:Uncharacterized protein n=1 Tax=Sugiyamaella lignohabitans TaxID=796027 RepID=A0A167CDY9_9ASCO|nr:uncharacterized protein AWJ20_4385 [Sugiyamaella lignohabitans]ANB11565.1 hypothetical protein AWJ20_4385 [Sugiyamaella lignohabitans]